MSKRRTYTDPWSMSEDKAWKELLLQLSELGAVAEDPMRRLERIGRAQRARVLALRLYEGGSQLTIQTDNVVGGARA
jgi:hypothetical protein